uniref:Tle cognate immunity protein 4 C-terminal domain-containing protein n=1 Tax=Dechloromonas aromatica (strain RCB) TaxID=159087 RepID=Q47J29_DECAR
MNFRHIVIGCLMLGLFLTTCASAAGQFDWQTDCVGRFTLALPGKVEVAMLVNKAFENPDDDPMYPTDAAITFLGGRGMAYYHFSDVIETSGNTSGNATRSTQSIGVGAVHLTTGPRADKAEFERFQRAMDSYYTQTKRRLINSVSKKDNEQVPFIEMMASPFSHSHAWKWHASYYLLWRDDRLFSYKYSETDPSAFPTPQYISDHIRSREIFEVPKEQGLCLHHAFLPDDGTLPRAVAMTYRLIDHPEIEIYFSDNFTNGDEKASPEKIINDFWESQGRGRYAKKLQLINPHIPGVVHFPDVELAGFKGKRSLVEITNPDGSLDHGYFAFVRGDKTPKDDRPDLTLYVVGKNVNATGTPLSKDQIEEIANHIASSIRRR